MNIRRTGIALVIVTCVCLSRAQSDEPVLLKYKASKGDVMYYKIGGEMKQTQGIMNMKLNNSIQQETIMSRVVDEIDADGNVTFKFKAERKKLTAEFGALGKYEFDSKSSERDTASAIGSDLTPLLERLTGSEYRVIVTPRGRVKEVKGFAELIADLLKDKPLAAQFAASDNKGAVVTEQDAFVVLSEKPVKPGDKWDVIYEVALSKVGKLTGKTTYTYDGPDKVGERNTARISYTHDMTFEIEIDQGAAKIGGKLSTTSSTGIAQFDPEAGRLISIKQSVSLGGQLSADAGGMTIPIDTQQEQTTTLELLDKRPQ